MTNDQFAIRLEKKITSDLAADRLIIPNLPELAVQANDLLRDEHAGVEELYHLVITDPPVAAHIIRITNSPLLRRETFIDDLYKCLSLLGLENGLNLVISLTLSKLFSANHPKLQRMMAQCWVRSTETATYACAVAKHFSKIAPEKALLAGLIHRIGALTIIGYADEHNDVDTEAINELLPKLCPELGVTILNEWGFSQELMNIPQQACDQERYAETADLADVVQVASLFLQKKDGNSPPWQDSQSILRLQVPLDFNFETDPEFVNAINESSSLLSS